jgi:glycosyltransferase involved in cell wall biosynthesis
MANGTGFALQALVRDLPRLVAIVPRAEGAGHSDPPWVRRKLRFSGRAGGPFKVFSLLQHAELLAAPLAWCLVHPRPALLVCSQPVFAGVAGRLVSAIFGVPYVVLGLGEEFTTLRHDRSPFQIRLRLLRAALRGASAVVCIAQHTRALVSDLYGVPSAKLPVIYPSVDVAEFASADEHAAQDLRRELAGAGPMVLMVGRLAETHKGFDRAIESWPDVLAGSPGAVLVIVGPGPQAPLAALARARGNADQVRLLCKVPRTKLLAL